MVITAGMPVFGTGLNMSFIKVALHRLAREFGVGPNSVTWWFSLQPSTGGAAVVAWEVGRFKRIIEALERSPLSPPKAKD